MGEDQGDATASADEHARAPFQHVFYPYDDDTGFLAGALGYIGEAAAGDELVIAAVPAPRERLLRHALAESGARVQVEFADIAAIGRNPGRLIPAWQRWLGEHAAKGHVVRGIGEPQWDPADAARAEELHYHEWLLNLAFAAAPGWLLLCPYDTKTLGPATVEAAERRHPLLWSAGAGGVNARYVDGPFDFEPWPVPGGSHPAMAFARDDLGALRDRIATCAHQHGMHGARLQDLLIAASEIAANSIMHGGGRGTMRTWMDGSAFVVEFHDRGHIRDPLVGRMQPSPEQIGGRGLWLAHQLCELVQIRSDPARGTTVRLHASVG